MGRLWTWLLWLGHATCWLLAGGRHTRLSDRLGRRYLAAWQRYWR
jgi:hypothetical protein